MRDLGHRAGSPVGLPFAQPFPVPQSAEAAVAMVCTGLGWLTEANAAGLTSVEQAECLRGLEAAESVLTAARAAVLTAFTAGRGFEDDGQGPARVWLTWQARVTGGAAAGAVGWMRRLAAHPAVGEALAAGQISASWARQVCAWSDSLPEEARLDADVILLAAAAAGAGLADLAVLVEEIRARTARPDRDSHDDGFEDRNLRLETTFGGAGRLEGDLTPPCAAALRAVLDVLGKRAGPEDLRTRGQRAHDGLEEACRRLIGAGGLPDRAGQPVQIQLHMTLHDLLRRPGQTGTGPAAGAGAPGGSGPAWPPDAGVPARDMSPGWVTAGPGTECDAQFVPMVTGRIDTRLLDDLAYDLLYPPGPEDGNHDPGGPAAGPSAGPAAGAAGAASATAAARDGRADRAARDLLTARAIRLLSGPGGLAAALRTRNAGPLTGTVSLPLDVGAVSETIPVHLRRAVITRDRHCRFPGCDQPPAACHPHHLIPRADGGPASLANLLLLCSFHHLIAVHRWGWQLTLHPDGTVTALSPDTRRAYHSHGPPTPTAA